MLPGTNFHSKSSGSVRPGISALGPETSAMVAGSSTLLASARAGTRQPAPSWADFLVGLVGTTAPDAIVYSNSALQAPANAKSAVLVNVLAGSYTHFISHPMSVSKRLSKVLGVPISHVESVHYNTNGTGTRREDGFGFVRPLGQGPNEVRLFINGRFGDTNLLSNSSNGIAVGFGFFGSPAALRRLLDRLPAGGRAAGVKKALEAGLLTASAGGSELGLAWRGTLQMNRETGQAELKVSGFKIPIGAPQDPSKVASAVNYGDKPIARVNNEDAYVEGANPFQRAEDTRAPNGGPYLNHGDPVAAIAGGLLDLQDRLQGTGARNIRTNAEARRFVENAMDDPRLVSSRDKARLQDLLAQLHIHGLYFGSARIEAAAREAAARVGAEPADAQTRAFVREVFQGKFRHASLEGYSGTDLARDVLLGINRWTALVTELARVDPLARDDITLQQSLKDHEGLARRLHRQGGALRALGLRAPAGLGAAEAERIATDVLAHDLAKRVHAAGRVINGQTLYEQFQQLGQAQRLAIGREIQGRLDSRTSGQAPPPGARRVIDGVAVFGTPTDLKSVGGVNGAGQALQGRLKAGRTATGPLVFWLEGRGTNYLLRGRDGQPLRNAVEAEARARELIRNRGATDLRAPGRHHP